MTNIMNKDEIKVLQKRIGAHPDGFWGPQSKAAVKRHLGDLMKKSSNVWPNANASALSAAFGYAGDETRLVPISAPTGTQYEGQLVSTIRCNKAVSESLSRVLERIANSPQKDILKKYAGCYNFRLKRGGASYSLHAYGAAIDFDPDNNGLHESWPLNATMPIEVMEEFAREGWKSAGAFWGYDAMHFECTAF